MKLEVLPQMLSVCKIKSLEGIQLDDNLLFLAKTDEEISLVCSTERVPKSSIVSEHGWRGFRICGELDFSLVGILSKISALLAEHDISIFVVSTYNTDYFLIKQTMFDRAVAILANNGYPFV